MDNEFEYNLLIICRYLTMQISVVIFLIIKYFFYPYTGAVFLGTTDDFYTTLSGVVFGYDKNKVRLWVPIDGSKRDDNGKYIFSLNK